MNLAQTKYLLPAFQMALTATVVFSPSAIQPRFSRICDMPGPNPIYTTLLYAYAPLTPPRLIWSRYVSERTSFVVLIPVVGIFWYWVALNVQSWREKRRVVMFSWRPARWVVDILLVACGLVCGLAGLYKLYAAASYAPSAMHGNGCYGPNPWFSLVPDILTGLFLLAWFIALVYPFGRDFIHSLRRLTS
jgi:hypothetical protein